MKFFLVTTLQVFSYSIYNQEYSQYFSQLLGKTTFVLRISNRGNVYRRELYVVGYVVLCVVSQIFVSTFSYSSIVIKFWRRPKTEGSSVIRGSLISNHYKSPRVWNRTQSWWSSRILLYLTTPGRVPKSKSSRYHPILEPKEILESHHVYDDEVPGVILVTTSLPRMCERDLPV